MRRVLTFVVLTIILALAAGQSARGQAPGDSTGALTADALKGLAWRGIGPALATGRIQDIAIDPEGSERLVRRQRVRRLVEDRQPRHHLHADLRRGRFVHAVLRRHRPERLEHRLARDRREHQSAQRAFRRRRLQVVRRRKTWKRVGLAASEHIGRMLIDPRNSNVVYVAAQGPLFRAGGERGVYKTTDGGATWQASLTISADTGTNDLAFDPKNPDILYASAYQRRRAVGQLIGGGPEGGIYKTTNAGKTWTKLTKGLPSGDTGRIALATDGRKSPATVFALINARPAEAGFYRSDDAGASWARIGLSQAGRAGGAGEGSGAAPADRGAGGAAADDIYRGGDPQYDYEIFVDPNKPDTIWSVNTNLEVSTDGGKTWKRAGFEDLGMHVDHHASRGIRAIGITCWSATTGGCTRATTRGNRGGSSRTFRSRSTTACRWTTRSRSITCAAARRTTGRMRTVADDEPLGHPHQRLVHRRRRRRISDAHDPDDPNIVYAQSQQGNITRLDLRSGEVKNIRPRQAAPPAPGEGDEGAGRAGEAGEAGRAGGR